MDERASNLLDDAMSLIKQSKWTDANETLQRFYSTLPKDPSLLVR